MLYDHALHSICTFTMFHAFRCVFICWKLCDDRFGLGWTHNAIFFAYHMFMHFSCIRILSFLSLGTLLWWYFSVCLPLSLSNSLCMAPKRKSAPFQNPLRSRASSSDLTPLHVWNTACFYRTFSILLYPLLFIVRDENLYVWYLWVAHRDHTGVLLQHAWFQYLYTLVCYAGSRYTYRSHSGYYFRDTTCSTGFTSWLPCLSTFEDRVQRWTFVSFLWDAFFMGWAPKHLMLRLCKMSKVPKHGDDICFPSLISL